MRSATLVLALVLGVLGPRVGRVDAQAVVPRIPPAGYPIALVDRPLVLPRGGFSLDLAAMAGPSGRTDPSGGRRDVGVSGSVGGSFGIVRRLAAFFGVPFGIVPEVDAWSPSFGLRLRLVPRTVELGFDTLVTAPTTEAGRPALGLGLPLQAHLAGRALLRFDPRYTVYFFDIPYHQLGARVGLDVRLGRSGDLGASAGLYGGGSTLASPTYQVPLEVRAGGTVVRGLLPRLDIFAAFGFPHLLVATTKGTTIVRQDYYVLVSLRVFLLDRAGAP